ncbi:MAG TPA: Hsp70 family protein [Pyrinomonadaceae bacterium]|nr:Hsp70 family protein [Pyrinomonadaceae bacterium]
MEPVIGLDFGTTNSAIAVADSSRHTTLAAFADGPTTTNNFRSILYFPAKERGTQQKGETKAGPEAINAYLDAETKGRLIVSIKSYLASRLFTTTSISGRSYSLEELIAIILRRLRTSAMEQFNTEASRVVLGRPVRFSGAENAKDEALALERLRSAAELAGFQEVSFEFEPVAAAYQYETQLDHDELVLIGDFGGGTSDFTLAQLGPGRKLAGRNPVVGTSGVAIAGDTFDSRIMMRLVAPKLGLGSHYVSLGKELPVPVWVYSQLSSWHHMFLLKDPKTMGILQQVKRQAAERDKVAALIQIISENLGYALYRAVEHTKVELTEKELADFTFLLSTIPLEDSLERWQFESWIQEDIQQIAACIRGLLDQAEVTAGDIDRVFLTGGSSFVPVVRRFFSRTFGPHKLRSGEELTTVAKGLALRALER